MALYAYSEDGTTVGVGFNKLLDLNTSSQAGNYTISGGVGVNQATLGADGQSVLLVTGGLGAAQFTVNYSGIADLSGNLATNSIMGTNLGLTLEDIGQVAGTGTFIGVSPTGFGVTAYGSDIFGTADSFNFVFEPLTNDFDVRLQIDGIPVAASYSTRGGLMARIDTTAGSPNVFAGTYGPSGSPYWVATERNTENATTPIIGYITRAASFSFPDAWVRLQRTGQLITTFYGTDGFNWDLLSTNSDIPLPDVLLVGVASVSVNNFSSSEFQYSNFGPTIPIPSLQIAATNGSATISWPADATGFQLQQTSQLSGTWTAVTNVPVQVTTNLQVTVPVTSSAMFYRLVY